MIQIINGKVSMSQSNHDILAKFLSAALHYVITPAAKMMYLISMVMNQTMKVFVYKAQKMQNFQTKKKSNNRIPKKRK